MPRKKRTRRRDDDDGAFPSKRRHTENTEPLVISDSETEEEEYKPTAREGRLRGRESRAPDRGLTEEEMMAWALRMSETEEGNAAQRRRQQEEEDMRLAIEQSLNANGMQTYGDPCESSSLAMTPVAESPARPPRQTPCSLSRSKRKRDVSAEDQFTTTTAVGVAQSRKPSDPLSQPAAPSEAPPLSKDAPVPALPPSEEVGPFHGRVLVSDSDRESQDSSVVLCSQAGGSPVFPQSPSQRAVLCLEKLSQAQEQDCRSAGFVLCSQSDPAPSPRLRPPSDGPCPKAALNSPETLPSTPSPPRPPPPSRPSVSERTSNPEPSNQRGGQREDANGDEGGRGRTQGLGRGAGRSRQTTLGVCVSVSERVAGSVLRGAVQPEQDFHTQMNLHWSDGEDDGEELIPAQGKEECPIVTQTLSPPRSQNAVCEQSSPSDSESLLRVVPSSVRSLVFSQDAVGLRAQTSGPAQNPPSPPGSRSPLIGCGAGAGAGGARGPRWKFTFRNMYTAPSAAASCSGGRGPTASPSLPGQATPPNAQRRAGPVLYYWGVPFCPRGQNPDTYTQVILSQLEVYEKSLKSAQRGLLRKAAWGEPLLPAPLKRPFSRRARLKRSRPARPIRTEEEEEQEEEEDPGEAPAEEEEEEEERGGSQRGVGPSGGGQDSEAFTAPSQSLLEQKSPLPEEPPEKFPFLRRRALRDRSPAESETQLLEEEEEEEGMCPETQLSEQNSQDVNMDSPAGSQPRPGSEVMEVQEEEEEQGSMEVDQAEEVQVCGERVECPICMRPFPLPQIEMHAAYCDGSAQPSTPDDSSPVMVLRKSARRPETTEEDQPGSSKATQEPSPEKCFLCQGQFPVKEYQSHVDACLRLKSHPTQGAKSLLTALERSEQKESEAGPSQEHSFSHAAPANADQSGDSGGVAFAVSNSPIKSFTPISQATDCLVDFKRQYSAKPSQRAGRKRKHR